MNKTDEQIVEALSAADKRLLEDMEEPAFYRMALGLYRGRNAWVTAIITLVQFVMFVVAIVLAWQFFWASDVLTAMKWGLPAMVFAITSTQLKMVVMAQLQADRVIAAMRRVELARVE